MARLPDDSTMSRRLRTLSVLQPLQRLHEAIGSVFALALLVKHIDSFPLPVGNYSKDREARRGRAAGAMARGYKLHAICVDGAIASWTLRAMNTNDQVPAPELFAQLRGGGYITADNGYDANPVHLAAAAANHQLLAPPRPSDGRVKLTEQQQRRNCRQRLQALDMLNCPLRHAGVAGRFGPQLHRQRVMMEQTLGHLRMLLLGTLPPWVRGPRRVARWMAAKLIMLNLRTAMARRRIKGLRL